MKNKRLYLRTICVVCAILLASLLITSCTTPATTTTASPTGPTTMPTAAGPKYGGIFKMGVMQDGSFIGYPQKMTKSEAPRHAAPAVESLLRTDKTGKIIPWLATDYKADANAKTITLSLRKGVKFHDGTDFNAEAAKWNLDQAIAAKQQGTATFKSIDIVDDFTVRINLSQWDNTTVAFLTFYPGLMVSPAAYKKNGEEWAVNNPVGTGPFQFVSWQKDAKTVWKKFDGYWQKGKPYLDGIEWITIVDPTVRNLALRNKEIDAATTIAEKDRADLEKEGFVIARGNISLGAFAPLVPDSANASSPFAKVEVRQAAAYAINGAAVLKALYYNEGKVTNQFSAQGSWAYDPSVVGYPYDPVKAKQLLAQAGYPNGFKTKLTFLAVPEFNQSMPAYQAFLKEVGIDVTLDPAPPPKYDQMTNGGGGWDGLTMAFISSPPDILAAAVQRYAGLYKGVLPNMAIPEDYAKALTNAVNATTFADEQKYFLEAQKLMIDKYCLIIPSFGKLDATAYAKYVKNLGLDDFPAANYQWTPDELWLDK